MLEVLPSQRQIMLVFILSDKETRSVLAVGLYYSPSNLTPRHVLTFLYEGSCKL